MIRTVIVAPALAVRAGLRAILLESGDFEITAEAARLEELDLPPDRVDLYLMQPDQETPLALPEVEAGVLVLSDDSGAAGALRGWPGGWGWLRTGCREDELLAALYAVAAGLAVLPPDAMQKSAAAGNGDGLPVELTERELEVLDLLADGYANKQISLALEISEHTVKFHVSSIYTKLNVSNRAEAVRVGIQMGLVVI